MASVLDPVTPKGHAARDRLLAAAHKVLIERGGHLEVADVGRVARMRPSLINHYFGSKALLIGAVLNGFYGRLTDEVLAPTLAEHPTWAARERHRVELGVKFHYDDPLAPVIYGPLARDPHVAALEAEAIAATVKAGARNVARGIKENELPKDVDPGLAAAAIFGSMRQILVEALGRTKPPPRARVVDAHWRQVAAAVHIDPETR